MSGWLNDEGLRIGILKCPASEVGCLGELFAMPRYALLGRMRAECRDIRL